MELSSIGVLGMYLLLAFVLPGFCYLLIFALCFRTWFNNCLTTWTTTMQPGKEVSLVFPVSAAAITGGLLLSSVSFALELLLRGWHCFDITFPRLALEEIARVEACGKGTLFLNIIAGSALMHLNIGLGILILLVIYVAHLILRSNNDSATWRVLLIAVLLIVSLANFKVSSTLHCRFRDVSSGLHEVACQKSDSK